MILRSDGEVTRGLENDIRNLFNFHATSRKFENLHFCGLLLSKACKSLDEKVQKSYVSWHWRVMQSLKKKKLTLGSKTDMKSLVNFNARRGQVWKFAHLCASFVESILCLSQKSTEELCGITLKNDAKFEEDLNCALKNDMRNLVNFDPAPESLNIFTLMGSFWPKYIMFELMKYRGVMRHYTENWFKYWRKNDLRFHKWNEEFGELHRNTQKL